MVGEEVGEGGSEEVTSVFGLLPTDSDKHLTN